MTVGIFSNEYQKKEIIEGIFDVLRSHDVEVLVQKEFYNYLSSLGGVVDKISGVIDQSDCSLDMAFSIGGDGTFLKTASLLRNTKTPILGINTGRLGFLADVSSNDFDLTLHEVLKGEYEIEERAQLKLTLNSDQDKSSYALNEVAVLKQDQASMITVVMYINGELLSAYEADGLIVATPTGSTAYSLSVGGAIMVPNTPNFIITAIAPHTLTSRPLVVGNDNVLTMEVKSRSCCFLVSVDGKSRVIPDNTILRLEKAEMPVYVVKRLGQTFYSTLRNKLKWGLDPRLDS